MINGFDERYLRYICISFTDAVFSKRLYIIIYHERRNGRWKGSMVLFRAIVPSMPVDSVLLLRGGESAALFLLLALSRVLAKV
jgi:hypothetical protein